MTNPGSLQRHSDPARSLSATYRRTARDTLTRVQRDSQRRFAFGYASGAVQSVSPGVNVATASRRE